MKPATPKSKPLLVVDDDANNRDMLSRRLIRAGYEVQCASDAREALSILDRSEFDLILLDSRMPGMSGVDMLRLLRATRSPQDLPVIMVTAEHESARIVEALSDGANDYITKPVDFSVALARVRAQLDRKRADQALWESEQRYSLAARGANDGLWDWDLRRGTVYYSARWQEMLGLERASIGVDPSEWLNRIHPDDRRRVFQELDTLLKSEGSDFSSEHRTQHRDGTYRWMLVRGHVVRDAAGKGIRMAGAQTDVTENKAYDSLTGLPNRVLLIDRITRGLETVRTSPTDVAALLFVDMDRFKVINDSLGHAVGDELLIAFSKNLQAVLKSVDGDYMIARLGGDEFAVFLEDLRHPDDAMAVVARIQESVQRPFLIGGRDVFPSISIGVAVADQTSLSAADLVRDADIAMYRAKALGRSRSVMFSREMRDAVLERLEMEGDLRRAIDEGQFSVFYQSNVALDTGRLLGFEALVRWNHPTRGLVGPTDFIPLAEETGLIMPMGAWVLREACRQARAWQEEFPSTPALEMSVNLSPKQFHHPDLIPSVQRALNETGLDPKLLQLEITESVLIEDAEQAIRTLTDLKTLGIGLKLDDFGTGYSSLNYLCRLPCDSLKIDRYFVKNMCKDGNSLQVIQAILSLAKSLGKTVVAEGIDSISHVTRLRDLGCEFGQGYYFSVPVPAEDAARLLSAAERTA